MFSGCFSCLLSSLFLSYIVSTVKTLSYFFSLVVFFLFFFSSKFTTLYGHGSTGSCKSSSFLFWPVLRRKKNTAFVCLLFFTVYLPLIPFMCDCVMETSHFIFVVKIQKHFFLQKRFLFYLNCSFCYRNQIHTRKKR